MKSLAGAGTLSLGVALTLLGALVFALILRTPAVELQHPGLVERDSQMSGLIRNPLVQLAVHASSGTGAPSRPEQPRHGLWIEVPSLRIALPIHPGDGSNNIPDWVALQYPGTVTPGRPGNSYLYAHGLWGMFGSLLNARVGEAVEIHNYTTGRVETLHVSRVVGDVPPNDRYWLTYRSASPTVTLQTCVDYNMLGPRFIVVAN